MPPYEEPDALSGRVIRHFPKRRPFVRKVLPPFVERRIFISHFSGEVDDGTFALDGHVTAVDAAPPAPERPPGAYPRRIAEKSGIGGRVEVGDDVRIDQPVEVFGYDQYAPRCRDGVAEVESLFFGKIGVQAAVFAGAQPHAAVFVKCGFGDHQMQSVRGFIEQRHGLYGPLRGYRAQFRCRGRGPLAGIGQQFPRRVPFGEPDPAVGRQAPFGRFVADVADTPAREDEAIGESIVVEACFEGVDVSCGAVRHFPDVFACMVAGEVVHAAYGITFVALAACGDPERYLFESVGPVDRDAHGGSVADDSAVVRHGIGQGAVRCGKNLGGEFSRRVGHYPCGASCQQQATRYPVLHFSVVLIGLHKGNCVRRGSVRKRRVLRLSRRKRRGG